MIKLKDIPFTEKWKSISKCEGYYEISNTGRVRSVERTIIHKNGKVRIYPQRILVPHTIQYPRVGLNKAGNSNHFLIHHLVCYAFIGLRPKDMHINHKDGVKTNNNLSNLEYVTRSENAKHAFRIGLVKSRKGISKFKDIPCGMCRIKFRPVRVTNMYCSKSCAVKFIRNH